MGKYDALAEFLRAVTDDQHEVVLTFGRIDGLVGGLPPSARKHRPWWANNSQSQSLAWNGSGWHVSTVDLAGSRVIFARGPVGGTYAARGRRARTVREDTGQARAGPSVTPAEVDPEQLPSIEKVDLRVVFDWRRLGIATLDPRGKVEFPKPLPPRPGLYRLTLAGRSTRSRIYIGETDNLRRRLGSNYRSPGPRQQTSLRINALLLEHLHAGASVHVDIAVAAELHRAGSEVSALDLSRKAGRLLAESAALVLAQHNNDADIENLG